MVAKQPNTSKYRAYFKHDDVWYLADGIRMRGIGQDLEFKGDQAYLAFFRKIED